MFCKNGNFSKSDYWNIKILCQGLLFLVILQPGQSILHDLQHLFTVPCASDAISQAATEPRNALRLETYDYIIVGAGSAGCVLARRLTDNPRINVLLIEAGGPEYFFADVPANAPFLQTPLTSWDYYTTPSEIACLGYPGNRCFLPRGRVMGGSSAINFMIYSRGNKVDYDHWEKLGAKGWNYETVLPYFKKVENFEIPELYCPKENGNNGAVTIEYAPYETEIAKKIGASIINNGINRFGSVNSANNVAASRLPSNTKNGTRDSASRAYLHPVYRRPNLHVRKNSLVTKILIEPVTKTAYGVEFSSQLVNHRVRARKEVIVSAGSIQTPQLLMLSGIGPAAHLAEHGIPVIVNSPYVGRNLQDHYGYFLNFHYNCTVPNPDIIGEYCFKRAHSGPLSIPGGCEFISLQEPDCEGIPQYELLIVSGQTAARMWVAFPLLLKPRSIGRITLRSKNPHEFPNVNTNYLSHPADVEALIQAGLSLMKINSQPELQECHSRLEPNPQCMEHILGSRGYFECVARHGTQTVYHQSCTCRMGSRNDETSVVDEKMRVIGVKNLRVCDGSIMPELPSAHPNAVVMMLAERGADLIKEDYHAPKVFEMPNTNFV